MVKILGVDWGKKRIGAALASTNLAEPWGVVSSLAELIELAERERAEKVVLGLPEGRHERAVRAFGERIKEELHIPVVYRSETMTSRQALEKLIEAGRSRKSRRELDAVSASLLLQEYLDSEGN